MSTSPALHGEPYGLTLDERVDGDAVLLAVAGNVDMAAAPALSERVGAILRRRPPLFVVDLSGVNFLATAGMSILMQAHDRCDDLRLSFRVVASGSKTARPMQLLGIDGLLDVHPTVGSALSAPRP